MTQTSRAFPYSSFIPAYANGLQLSNNSTTPNTKLDVSSGSILDSTGTFQLALASSVTIDATVNGINGLDTGSLAASTVYAVYLVADVVNSNNMGAMISTSYTAPLMPFGYNSFALIGYVATDGAVHFLKGYWTAGDSPFRLFMYDAPQATAVTAGNNTAFATGLVDLSALVPKVDNIPVWMYTVFTPGAASRTLEMQPAGGTGSPIKITGQVTSVIVTSNSYMYAKLSSSLPKIAYQVSNAGDAVAIDVAGYNFIL